MLQHVGAIALGALPTITGIKAAHDAKKSNEAIAGRNEEMQREFAQMGIRWKVEDAKAAGIHPLAALGAQTHSFSPSQNFVTPDNSLGQGLADMGQNVLRATAATQTEQEKSLMALQLANAQAELEGKHIDNAYRASQLKQLNSPQAGPGLPGTSLKPSEMTMSPPGHPDKDAGYARDMSYARTRSGFTPVPSASVKERIEDNVIQETLWALRNNIMPLFSRSAENPPPSEYGDKGRGWYFQPLMQEYRPIERGSAEEHFRYNFYPW